MNRLIILLLFVSANSFAQTADDIINKYIAATGGQEKWSKVASIKLTGNYVLGPGMQAPVTEVLINKPFNGFYFDFAWQGMTSKRVVRADSGWRYDPFGGKRETDPLSPNDIRGMKLEWDPQGALFNYKEKGYAGDYLGTDDMDGTDVYKLRLTNKDGDMIYYYIDQETNYILKITTRVKLKDKEEKDRTAFSDFRKTPYGIIIPFTQQDVDDNGNEQGGPMVFTKAEVNGNIDASLFDNPKTVK